MLLDELRGLFASGERGTVQQKAKAYLASPANDPREAAEVCILACHAAALEQQWRECTGWAEHGLEAGPDTDHDTMGRLNLWLGISAMYNGDYYRSDEALAMFHHRAERAPTLAPLIADGLFNRAILMRCMRREGNDICFFEQAEDAYAVHGRLHRVLQCQANVAWSHLLAGRVSDGFRELQELEQAIAEHGDADIQIDVQTNWALYYRLIGSIAKSQDLIHATLTQFDPTSAQRADLLWIMSLNAQTEGDTEAAWSLITLAHREAVKDWWPLQIERVEAVRRSLRVGRVGR